MKPTAFLVNTSRGPIVDEAALIEALRSRQIAGAGLDVYDTEPLPPTTRCSALENTVLTPHLGYVSREGLADDVPAGGRGPRRLPARRADPRDRLAGREPTLGQRQPLHSAKRRMACASTPTTPAEHPFQHAYGD